MAVNYSSTLKTNRMQLVADLIAGKVAAASTGTAAAGKLVIGTSSLNGSASDSTAAIATFTLSTTPGTVSGSVFTLSGTPLSATASLAGTNTAAKAEIRDSANNVIVSGLTVGTSSADIIIGATSVTQNQNVSVTSGTITHA